MSNHSYCAIDFGTSNSAIALPADDHVRLVELEGGQHTMPTAVFYNVEDLAPGQEPQRSHGRAAMAAYVEGTEGRLMRSMKSILGSNLATQTTDLGQGHSMPYLDVIVHYLTHLKRLAEQTAGQSLTQVVLGRPVFFVDDDTERDQAAQATLAQAAQQVGFQDIQFQYEPIAAALDYEARCTSEQIVLVADIGGGTSDFSLVRVGPRRRDRLDRRDDILANHGVHRAGTDFDRGIELTSILPHCGFRALGPSGREVPSRVYFDLATWHLINTVYNGARMAELRRMQSFYADTRLHTRLMKVLDNRLGHALVGLAEQAKIAVAQGAAAQIDLTAIEKGLHAVLHEHDAITAINDELTLIAHAAQQTLSQARWQADRVDAIYFTGGSTGLTPLVERIAAQFPNAQLVHGDRLASVAQGLGWHARRVFDSI